MIVVCPRVWRYCGRSRCTARYAFGASTLASSSAVMTSDLVLVDVWPELGELDAGFDAHAPVNVAATRSMQSFDCRMDASSVLSKGGDAEEQGPPVQYCSPSSRAARSCPQRCGR